MKVGLTVRTKREFKKGRRIGTMALRVWMKRYRDLPVHTKLTEPTDCSSLFKSVSVCWKDLTLKKKTKQTHAQLNDLSTHTCKFLFFNHHIFIFHSLFVKLSVLVIK